MTRAISFLLRLTLLPFFVVSLLLLAPLSKLGRHREAKELRLLWGIFPVMNYKYWSLALREAGWESETVTLPVQHINVRSDFDRYIFHNYGDNLLARTRSYPRWLVGRYLEFIRALFKYDVFHHTFDGGFLGETALWRIEAYVYKLAGIRSVVLPVGGDAFMYSRVQDPSLRHGLRTLGYEASIRGEKSISSRVEYWMRHADVVICGLILDGMGRWDVLPVSPLSIDIRAWAPRQDYSNHDGRTGPYGSLIPRTTVVSKGPNS